MKLLFTEYLFIYIIVYVKTLSLKVLTFWLLYNFSSNQNGLNYWLRRKLLGNTNII